MTNIEFLIKVLDKQFSLVNCSRTTEDVMKMSEEEQAFNEAAEEQYLASSRRGFINKQKYRR